MSFVSVFDVLGPNMIGPSSSHTAGAAVIAHLAQKMIEAVQKVIVLVDSSKFGRRGFCKMCDVDQIDMVVTDDNIPPTVAGQLREKGIDVRIVMTKDPSGK